MIEKDWTTVVETDFPKVEQVTKSMVFGARNQNLQMRGSVRLMTGKLVTSEALEQRRQRALKSLLE